MPSWGTATPVEIGWTVGFGAAVAFAVLAYRAWSRVRRRPPVPGVPETAQQALAGFFVHLCRVLIAATTAGLLLSVYAALLPSPPAPPPAWAASVGNAPGVVLLSVLAGSLIVISFAVWRVYRSIAHAVDLTEDVAVVPRKPGGRRSYDRRPDEEPEAP